MSAAIIQLLVLAGVAIFLILRLRNVLGTRDGFEKPPVSMAEARKDLRREFEVIEGGPDTDITDHAEDGSPSAKALAAMKVAEPSFAVSDFLHGSRGAYEMILMAFERGTIDEVKSFLSEEVHDAFASVIAERAKQGLTVEATFSGVREVALERAEFDRATQEAEVTVRFVGELTSVVRNAEGEIIEGNPREIKRQRDVWTFARKMGSDDPNWLLVATGG